MGNRCINLNNSRVQEIAKTLNIPPALAASKIEVWMDNNNNKIPKVEDIIGNRYYDITKDKEVYEKYKLLNKDGSIKLLSEKEAKDWADSMKDNTNYSFHVRPHKGLYRILIFNPFTNAKDDMFINPTQLPLFVKENTITYIIDRGTMEENKFKTFLGSNNSDSQTALKKIAESDTPTAAIAKKLLKSDLNVDIEIVDVDFFTKNNLPKDVSPSNEMDEDFRGGGFYDATNRKIYIARGARAATPIILLHEILHAQTKHYMATNPNSAAVKNLNRILEHLRNQSEQGKLNNTYPLTNIDELLTGVFTNLEFVKELKLLPATTKNFKSLWNEILQTIKTIFGINEVSLLDELFSYSAQIVEDSIDSFNQGAFESEIFGEVSFSKENVEQTFIVNSLLDLQGKQTAQDDHYTIEGSDEKFDRASKIAKKDINVRETYKTPEQEAQQEKFMSLGTMAHAIQAEYIRRAFPEANKHIAPLEIKLDMIGVASQIETNINKVIKQAKKEGVVLMAEVFVANSKTKQAGTIDLLGVRKDGSYKIYDLKTRFQNETEYKFLRYRYNKLIEFSKQMKIYKEILTAGDLKLGIPAGEVDDVRVLETNVKINYKTGNIEKIGDYKEVAPLFMRTKDEKINDYINKLSAQISNLLEKEPKGEIEKETWNKLLASKMELFQSLVLQQDVNEMFSHIAQEIKYIEYYMKDEENFDVHGMLSELKIYSNLLDYVDFDKLPEYQQKLLKEVSFDAQKMLKKLEDRIREVVIESSKQTGTFDIVKSVQKLLAPFKDINWGRRMFMGLSDVDNPITATAVRLLGGSLEKGRGKLMEFSNKLIEILDEYKKETGGLNFDILLNSDKKSLIDKYQSEFYKEKYKAAKAGDLKWAKENMTYDKDKYEEARKTKLDYLDSRKEADIERIKVSLIQQGVNPEEIKELSENVYWAGRRRDMDNWFIQNEKNAFKYGIPKDKWLEPKWIAIKEGKYKDTAVENFYDFYIKAMETANEVSPDYIAPTFLPNFGKDFIQRLSDNGLVGGVQEQFSELLNNFTSEYDENLYGQIDPATGKPLNKLFIPGTSKFFQQKSTDLGKSLLMFMEGVYRYEELSAIEDTIHSLRYQLSKIPIQKFDSLGNPISSAERVATEMDTKSNTLQLFDDWIDNMLYNKKRKQGKAVEVTGNKFTEKIGLLKSGDKRKLEYAKLLDAFIAYTGLKNLGFNMYSPISNYLAGKLNLYSTGHGGLYYSNTDLNKASVLVTQGKTNFKSEEALKMRLILDWLQMDMDKSRREMFRNVSNEKLNIFLADYNSMTLMRESEIALMESGVAAMILSGKHGIKIEDFEIIDGKIKPVEAISPLEKSKFKQLAIKVNGMSFGAVNEDDIMAAKQWVVGRMFTQHRGWLPKMYFERFGTKQYNYSLDKDIEGRYIVGMKALNYIRIKGITQGWDSLTPEEKHLAKSAAMELITMSLVGLLALGIGGADDDEKKKAWYKYTKLISDRTFNELRFFIDPTFESQYSIVVSPAPVISSVEQLSRFGRDVWREGFADMYENPEQIRKKAKPGEKLIKAIPFVTQVERVLDDLSSE